MFENFDYMLRGAGGIGCMRVAFESGFLTNLCLVLSLEKQKKIDVAKKKKKI